jgi:rare lipoprotein A
MPFLILGVIAFLLSFIQGALAESGIASIYGRSSGKKVACGGNLNEGALTAAHKTLPCGSRVRVRADDGRSVVVTINDRGPFIRGRVIDLTLASASALGLSHKRGLMHVVVEK